jgi:hypothetical protein
MAFAPKTELAPEFGSIRVPNELQSENIAFMKTTPDTSNPHKSSLSNDEQP